MQLYESKLINRKSLFTKTMNEGQVYLESDKLYSFVYQDIDV